ncbi:MAG: DUF2470 domain-containing protein, partial [Candidatus Eremiobacterota bacterium]
YRDSRPDPVAPLAEGIRQHMDQDHEGAMIEMAAAFGGIRARSARLTEVDRYGFEMTLQSDEGRQRLRLNFTGSACNAEEVRREMVELVRQARAAEATPAPSETGPR